MRKFFVSLLLLGVFTATGHVQQSGLPGFVTNPVSINVNPKDIDSVDAAVVLGKKQVAKALFHSLRTVINPELAGNTPPEHQAKQIQQVQKEFNPTFINLINLERYIDSRAAQLDMPFMKAIEVVPARQEADKGQYVKVKLEVEHLQSVYAKMESQKREEIRQILAEAKTSEAVDPGRAAQLYQATYPHFHDLKKSILFQLTAQYDFSQENAHAKLLERVKVTQDDSPMSETQVIRYVTQIQPTQITTMDGLVTRITSQFIDQLNQRKVKPNMIKGVLNSGITFDGASSSDSAELTLALLEDLSAKYGIEKQRGFQPAMFMLYGSILETGVDDAQLSVVLSEGASDTTYATAVVTFSPSQITDFRYKSDPGYVKTVAAIESTPLNAYPGTVPEYAFTGKELTLEAVTNHGRGSSVYAVGDLMEILCRVNQPAYIRVINILADGTPTLLLDDFYINSSQVDQEMSLGSFVCTPPVGRTEILMVQARTEKLPELQTYRREDGYRVIQGNYLNKSRGFKEYAPPDRTLTVTTTK